MGEHSLYDRIIAQEAGWWSAPLRSLLSLVEWAYATAIHRRNRRYDRGVGCCSIAVPVISVGNLTIGGTGKTPMVIHLVRRLEQMGFSPAVVARGYKSEYATANDEERVIRARAPGVSYVADSDRVAGAQHAIRRMGSDVIVLDDGFQHRRLSRDLDMVLIDSCCPFGHERLLPRGLLREPLTSLARAHVVVLTRCDQVSPQELDRIGNRVASLNRQAPVLRCRHRISAIERWDETPVPGVEENMRAVVFAGIARPRSFLTTVRSLGINVVGVRWWPDHHRYRARDLAELVRPGRFPPHDVLITTEKDAVKLRLLPGLSHLNLWVVRIDIDFEDDGGTILDRLLSQTLGARQVARVERQQC